MPRLLRAQGLHVAKDTLHQYVAHLEDALLVRPVYIATDSPGRRMTNPRKVYPIDMGLIPVFDRSGRANVGHALESAALLEFERCGAEVGYVRTPGGFEVDLPARLPDGGQHLIQVCADLSTPATREREFRALLDAREEFPHASAHVVSLDLVPPRELPEGIQWHAAGAWLLGALAALDRNQPSAAGRRSPALHSESAAITASAQSDDAQWQARCRAWDALPPSAPGAARSAGRHAKAHALDAAALRARSHRPRWR